MANVAFIRKDLEKVLPLYYAIRDCIEGEAKIKKGKTLYLPKPDSENISDENSERYEAYLLRAVFYNVSGRTLKGLVGQVFYRDPVVETTAILNSVREDANGGGVNIVQSAKRALAYVLAHGRCGLFIDYPSTDGFTTKAELEKGDIRPTINNYAPWRIINWNFITRGAKQVLSFVVLVETYISSDDGFETKEDTQYRVLKLGKSEENKEPNINQSEDVYTVEIWRKDSGVFGIFETYQPKDANGSFLKQIPFIFLGSENNDAEIDNPPLYDLVSLNIAHYRNSADYEESCNFVGQPTPWFSGLHEEWVANVLHGSINLGSRGAVLLPENGTGGLLQVAPNTMAFEAMQHKERQMVALGAKLAEQATVQRTATEANIEESSENSILSSSAKNVSAAYTLAFEYCLIFLGGVEKITFELNTDFDIATMTSQERQQVVSEWAAGAITFGEMRDNLRKSGVAKLEDDEAKKQIAKEQPTDKVDEKEKTN